MVKRTITLTTILFILTIAVGLIVVLNKSSFATEDDIASGIFESVNWRITSEGQLIIGDGTEQTFSNSYHSYSSYPWYNYKSQLTSVKFDGIVHGNGDMNNMFSDYLNIITLDMTGFDTSNVTSMNRMFQNCSNITSLDLSGFDTSKVTDMCCMFAGCYRLTSLNVSSFNTSKVTNMAYMFEHCSKLTSLDLSNWDVANVTTMYYMFYNYSSNLTTLDLSGWCPSSVTNLGYMFCGCTSLTSLDLSSWDTSNVTNMEAMFANCNSLTTLNISNFNTAKVTNMESLFHWCKSLTYLDVSSFNTSNVTTMECMFADCSGLTALDITKFNTSKVTNMLSMFSNCSSLLSIDVTGFDTSSIEGTDMMQMFEGCSSLESLDLSNFNIANVTNLGSFFYNCSNLTYLDISSFDTSNVNVMFRFFEGDSSIKRIKLGPDFSFKGNGSISSISFQALLPNPLEDEYSGKWIREDKAFGPYTAEELKDNYDGSTMAGTWIRERKTVTVTYSYIGTIPQGASELPDTRTYGVGENVTIEPDATAPGYTFSGWSRTGTFEMPAENVEITGSFTANTNTPYKVEHYLEDLTEGEYTLTKTDNLTGTTDTEAQANAKDYEGFTFDSSITGTNLSGNIAGDGSLVLKLYYKRNSYNVTYAYTGYVPDDASPLPQGEKLKYGADISVPDDATAEGYTFSSWIKDYITMPAQDIEITGYFIENPKSYNYKVKYYFDGELDNSLEEILNAEKDEEISITPQTPLKHGKRNYTLISNNHNITISINEEENVINVYYETDVLDYEIDNSEDTVEGDGIPDKYQIKINYIVENGSWDDGTKETKIDVITLKDKDRNYAENGTGELNVPQVGNKPAEGYTTGSWSTKIPNKVSRKDDGKEFVYSYKTISKADISEAKGKLSNPKTDDIMQNYLLIGVAGVLVLIIVRKIRRKYSRKANKIQY